MSIETTLLQRSGSKCEMCTAESNLSAYELPESPEKSSDCAVMLCGTCLDQISNPETLDENHWRCLNDSMWSQVPVVQVMAHRMLKRFRKINLLPSFLYPRSQPSGHQWVHPITLSSGKL